MSTANKSTRLLSLILIAAMAAWILLASRQQQAASQSRRQVEQERLKADIDKVERSKAAAPRADYLAPEPENPALRQLRRARGKRYRNGRPLAELREDTTDISSVSHE